MRLVDVVLRQGHLSERALTEAILTGDRPLHLDRCDICADRALELGRWLDGVRAAALSAADQAFPAERLAAQQAQILRRLEQADEPARVIAFPKASAGARGERGTRRVAPAWVGVAAAAGLIVGAIGGQASARIHPAAASGAAASGAATTVASGTSTGPIEHDIDLVPDSARPTSLLDIDLETYTPEPLGAINDMTPRVVNTAAVYQ
jgi:hypothetical protein